MNMAKICEIMLSKKATNMGIPTTGPLDLKTQPRHIVSDNQNKVCMTWMPRNCKNARANVKLVSDNLDNIEGYILEDQKVLPSRNS